MDDVLDEVGVSGFTPTDNLPGHAQYALARYFLIEQGEDPNE